MNNSLLKFFSENFRPGAIGLIGSTDWVSLAIREAQRPLTVDQKSSLWSHVFICGEMRQDRCGPNRSLTLSPYAFESSLHLNVLNPQLKNGAQETWIGGLCSDDVEHSAVIDFPLNEQQREVVIATALQLVGEQIRYPIHELIGTWWAIVTRREWLPNPLDDPHAMYCSAYARYCFKEAGADFMSSSVALSNTTPEHIAQAGEKEGRLIRF